MRLRSLAESPDAYGQTVAEAAAEADATWETQARTGARGTRRTWLVAERTDAGDPRPVVGVATGRRRVPDTLLVFSVWVAPEVRGTGTGRALIEACEAWGRAWGARRTLLWVVRGNAAALGFYAALGFVREVGTEDAARGAGFDAWALTRPIG
ncbi:MAG: GNAT family N-acetyltransferase [Chloroflexota bacterium]